MFKSVLVRENERGIERVDGRVRAILQPGRYTTFGKRTVEVVSTKPTFFVHDDLEMIAKSGLLREEAKVIDLKVHQRALLWVDGRFHAALVPGLWVVWAIKREVKVDIYEAATLAFSHPELSTILEMPSGQNALMSVVVNNGEVGVLKKNGAIAEILEPGRYAFWKNVAKLEVQVVDTREIVLDIAGQEIMTADKVTLRMNAIVTYRVADVRKSLSEAQDFKQAIYRDSQLALRAIVGTRELDTLLAAKEEVAAELMGSMAPRALELGVRIVSVGVRDVVLPGDMRELLNKVTEARKAAEASLITRREETAAMRSHANTAKLFENNPMLMRLREIEALEKIADKAKLNVVLGEKGLAERIVNML